MHYRGDFVWYRYRCVQSGHVSAVILCGTDACRVVSIKCGAMCPCSPDIDTDQKY